MSTSSVESLCCSLFEQSSATTLPSASGIQPVVPLEQRPTASDTERHVAQRMEAFSELLGHDHAAATVLAQQFARDWLTLTAPPPQATTRQRCAAICIVSDNAVALLSPCFLLNSRFALCTVHTTSSPLPEPLSTALSVQSSAPWYTARPPSAARAVLDFASGALVEAHHLPGRGTLYRCLVIGAANEVRRNRIEISLFAFPNSATGPSAIFNVSLRRRCTSCEPSSRECRCPQNTTLQSVSPPFPRDAEPLLPLWLTFAERLHNVLHGTFSISTTASMSRRDSASGPSARFSSFSRSQVPSIAHPTAQQSITVTINDPRISSILSSPVALQSGPAPRPLLPRPGPAIPPTTSTM